MEYLGNKKIWRVYGVRNDDIDGLSIQLRSLDHKHILVIDNDFNYTNAIKTKYNSILKSDPTTIKSVYFDSNSTYPRSKLKDRSSILRKLKLNTADAVVCNTNTLKILSRKLNSMPDNTIYISDDNNELFIIDSDIVVNLAQLNSRINERRDVHNQVTLSLLYINKRIVYGTYDKYTELANNVYNVYKNIITDSTLEELVNVNLTEIPDDTVQQIIDLVSSTDPATYKLGMGMLSYYSIYDSLCKMAIILFNRSDLYAPLGVNEKQIVTLIEPCNSNWWNIKNNTYKQITILYSTYNISTSETDKEYCLKYIRDLYIDDIKSATKLLFTNEDEYECKIKINNHILDEITITA